MSERGSGGGLAPPGLPRFRRLHLAAGFAPACILEALDLHRRCLAGAAPGRVLKQEAPTAVTLVLLGDGRPVCVKEYTWRGRAHRLKDLLRPAPARREWQAAGRLAELGVRVAEAYALLEAPLLGAAGSGFLILEGLRDSERLDDHVASRFGGAGRSRAGKRRMLEVVADHLRGLHDAGIHHGDTKAANLLVREHDEGWDLCLVDLADVTCGRTVGYAERTMSLAQLNASVPLAITATDRLRFLRRYARGLSSFDPLARPWRDILRITRTRKCIWDKEAPGTSS